MNQREAFTDFRRALVALLEVHGCRLTERSRVRLDARPGMFVLSEVDGAHGERPQLIIAADDRSPETLGNRLAGRGR